MINQGVWSDVDFPFRATCPGLDDYLVVDGKTQYNVYIEVEATDRAVTEIGRGRIMPVNLIYGDSFERNTTGNWSASVP